MLFENCYCFVKLVFSEQKKIGTKLNPPVFLVLFVFFRIENISVFENIENTILVFSKNCYCSLHSVFCVCLKSKKLKTKHVLPVFLILLVFENKKQF